MGDPGENLSISYLTRFAHRMFVKVLAIKLAPHGISTGQWSILRVLWEEEDLSQVEVAQRMNVEKASITSVLNQMARKGLVSKRLNRDDRRKIKIALTVKGRQLKDELLPYTTQITNIATRDIKAADLDRLRSVLVKVIENLEAGSNARVNGRKADKSAVRPQLIARPR